MVWLKGPSIELMSRPLLGTSASEIGIDRQDREPIQQQIARQIRSLVLSGRLKPQSRLPSTRALSEELAVARATVVEAYEQLLSEGYLETRSGSGTRTISYALSARQAGKSSVASRRPSPRKGMTVCDPSAGPNHPGSSQARARSCHEAVGGG